MNKIKSLINKIKNRWTLYLYLNDQCIYKMKIDSDFAPMGKIYVIKVHGLKHLIGTNRRTQIIVEAYKYKYTDEEKKTSHIEVRLFEGVEVQ